MERGNRQAGHHCIIWYTSEMALSKPINLIFEIQLHSALIIRNINQLDANGLTRSLLRPKSANYCILCV